MGVRHGTSTPNGGPTLTVRLSLTRAEARRRWRANLPTTTPIEVTALLDTGAQVSCVSADVVRRLGASPTMVGLVNAPAATGLGASLRYVLDLRVPNHSRQSMVELVVVDLTVHEIDLDGSGYDMILGRDVLAQCVFTYDGLTDSFTLSH